MLVTQSNTRRRGVARESGFCFLTQYNLVSGVSGRRPVREVPGLICGR